MSVASNRASRVVALAHIFLFSGVSFASDALDEIIVTGSKFTGEFGARSGIALEKVPQSVQVLSSTDIANLGAQTIGDLLRTVPSASAGYSRVGAYQSFSLKIRGFLADQMRNGIRQRYYEDVDASALSNIERVEVLKGPSGVLYGQSAVGGIISIITKQPSDSFSAELSGTLGSHSQRMLAGDLNASLPDALGLRMTGEFERSDTFVDHQNMDRDNLAFALRYRFSDRATGHLATEYVERRTERYPGLPVAGTVISNGVATLESGLNLGEPAVDSMQVNAPLVQVWLDYRLNDTWTLTPRAQYQEFNTDFTQIRLRSPQSNLTTINRTGRSGREDDSYTIGQIDLSGKFDAASVTHRLLLGYEYDLERGRFTQFNLGNVAPINVLAPRYSFATTTPVRSFAYDQYYDIDGHALYLQDQLALSSHWDVVASLRHSWIKAWTQDVGGPIIDKSDVRSTIWQLGTTLQLAHGFSAYAGYSTGFDVESSAGARSANGEPLKPEDSEQIEVGLRLKSSSFRGSLSMFEIKRINALTTDPLNPDFSLNTGAQRVRGIEVEGEWTPRKHWTISGGYARMDSEITRSNDGDKGLRIGDVPANTFTFRMQTLLAGTKLTLKGGISAVSNRPLTNGNAVLLAAYSLVDMGASYPLQRIDVDIIVSNLLGERYFTASGNAFAVIPGDPRSVHLRLKTRW
jgi:iron complex outermembrane recepter protein